MMKKRQPNPHTVAAIDLGSNSFHMIVARIGQTGTLSVIDRLRESVRLGGGLTKNGRLKKSTQQRALRCLETFAQRVRDLPDAAVRIAGTNTLRVARNAGEFVAQAEAILHHPVEIIAGREEARLIYLGVAHGLAAGDNRRLVVDIGGGSTEFIIGRGMTPHKRESLSRGCVSASRKFFEDGRITDTLMDAAQIDVALELLPHARKFTDKHWQQAIGCAGTIRAIRDILHEQGWCHNGIERDALYQLRRALIDAGHIDAIRLKGLSDNRRPILAGGLSILLAVFDILHIEHMEVSDQSMREGLLYDLVGRIRHDDVRDATVENLIDRWDLDGEQSARVATTTTSLLEQYRRQHPIDNDQLPYLIVWAARLHEIGLPVSHAQHHKHGAYILNHADMQGFSRQEQALLATLVLNHRGKFHPGHFRNLMKPFARHAEILCILLRIAVLIHRGRTDVATPELRIRVDSSRVQLTFPEDWLAAHRLTQEDLKKEVDYLARANWQLHYR